MLVNNLVNEGNRDLSDMDENMRGNILITELESDDIENVNSTNENEEEQNDIIVKLFNGNQSSYSMSLSAGTVYVVGSDLLADIIILDDEVEPKQFELCVVDNKLTISGCKAALVVNGNEVDIEDEVYIPLNSMITLGSSELFVGFQDSPRCLRASSTKKDSEKFEGLESLSFIKKQSRLLYLCAALTALTLGVHTIFTDNSIDKLIPIEDRVREVESQLSDFDIKSKLVTSLPDKKVGVSGYVMSDKEYAEVLNAIGKYGSNVFLSVSSAQNLIEKIIGLLSSFELSKGVAANFDDSGKLIFKGVVESEQQWSLFKSVLVKDIPYLSEFEDIEVITTNELIEKISPELEKYGGKSSLTMAKVGEEIMVRGALDPAELPKLEKHIKQIKKNSGAYPKFVFQVSEAEDPLSGLVVKLISNTGKPYLILDNGKRYNVGEVLENGYVVSVIKSSSIVLDKNGRQIELPI